MVEQVWRANVTDQKVAIESVPSSWYQLGGRGLIARICLDEISATCDPLGKSNKLIWSPGLLVGHMVPTCDRISVGGKSPLTGGIKESNAGGSTGKDLSYLGIRALILEGKSSDDNWWLLHLDGDGGQFLPADDIVGLGIYQTASVLLSRYGKNISLILIGPAGEMRLRAAGIQNLDKDGEPSRINARGGLGSIMGSKKIKGIIIDPSRGEKPPIADHDLFVSARKEFTRKLFDHPWTKTRAEYGTVANTLAVNAFGGLPTYNFSSGVFSSASEISGEEMRKLIIERNGEGHTTHACMAGCIVRCSNSFANSDGMKIVSPIEYETVALVGSNLGIDNLDKVGRINREINDLGLDSIEVGGALGVAAEAGIFRFGDYHAVMKLIGEIRKGTPLGHILGNGVWITGKVLGVERIPAVKGQAIPGYDPRIFKGIGITYATSPQGADHTAGPTWRSEGCITDRSELAKLSLRSQIKMAAIDTLGICLMGTVGFNQAPDALRRLLVARYGWEIGDNFVEALGVKVLEMERDFNRSAGIGPERDQIPEWMKYEKLPPNSEVFDISQQIIDSVFN